MGFFFSDPHEHQHKQIEKALKGADLSERQRHEFMEELEAVRKHHGSDRYREDHVKEAVRRLRDRAGDSLQGTHIERAARHASEHLAGGHAVQEADEAREPKPSRDIKMLGDHVDVPKGGGDGDGPDRKEESGKDEGSK